MKVTSDACIFGSWLDLADFTRILDIGTGTGLLALMSAQRTDAQIDALEIDGDAARQAQDNVATSPWKDRITVIHQALKDYITNPDLEGAYDCLICNPPFYDQTLKSHNEKKRIAWHADQLNLEALMDSARYLLRTNGSIYILVPFIERNRLEMGMASRGLYPQQTCYIRSFSDRQPHRLMAEFTHHPGELSKQEIIVYRRQQEYSEECKRLLTPYFTSL